MKIVERYIEQSMENKQKQWEKESLEEYENSKPGHRNNDVEHGTPT